MEPLAINTDRERHLLYALALMSDHYLGEEREGRTILDHMWMGAGEEAYKALQAYGLIEIDGRGATWTQAGEQLLGLPINQEAFPR